MPGAARMLLRRCSTAAPRRDGGLLDALRSELRHELSSAHTPNSAELQRGSKVGSFNVDWDDANTQDLVLRRRFASGEELAVSALLGPLTYAGDEPLPRHALMKVCVKKPQPDPILQFDCEVFCRDDEVDSEFVIQNAKYLSSTNTLTSSGYKGPRFSCLDIELQEAFKDYLVKRGINVELTNSLLFHLQHKEQEQYVTWLRKLEKFFKRDA